MTLALGCPSLTSFDPEFEVDAFLIAAGAGVVELGVDDFAFHAAPVALDHERDAGVEEVQKKVLERFGGKSLEAQATVFVEIGFWLV